MHHLRSHPFIGSVMRPHLTAKDAEEDGAALHPLKRGREFFGEQTLLLPRVQHPARSRCSLNTSWMKKRKVIGHGGLRGSHGEPLTSRGAGAPPGKSSPAHAASSSLQLLSGSPQSGFPTARLAAAGERPMRGRTPERAKWEITAIGRVLWRHSRGGGRNQERSFGGGRIKGAGSGESEELAGENSDSDVEVLPPVPQTLFGGRVFIEIIKL